MKDPNNMTIDELKADVFQLRGGLNAAMRANKNAVSELVYAHKIIRNALNLMTLEQKNEWAKRNEKDGVSGEGATRANEREAAIAKAAVDERQLPYGT